MKTVKFEEITGIPVALSDISVIYQTPTWDKLGSLKAKKGRKLNGFLLIDSGQCRYDWEGGQAVLKHGGLIYLGAGCKRTVTVTKRPFSFYRISFTMTEVESGEQIVWDDKPWVATEAASKTLYSLCEAMLRSTLSPADVFRSSGLMFDFLDVLTKQLKPKTAGRIAPALEYMLSHYTEELDVAALAQLCALSESQFYALFKEQVGMSPIRYKNHLRVEQAKLLLESEECSSQEIASMLGFENVYYFSRVFKSYTGLSPANYMKQDL